MTPGTRVNRTTSRRNEFLGMLTEVIFACGLIGLGLLISWLFFVGR